MKNFTPKLFILFSLLVFIIISTTCKKLELLMLVSTGEVTSILTNSADAAGEVIDLGEGAIQHGHCYAMTPNLTVSDIKTELGEPIGKGGFTSQLTNLEPGKKYYVKAYLSNENETVYGKEKSFFTESASVPGAPTIGTATAGNAQASVTFTAPASDGGSAITGYTVTSSPGGITGTGTASPITVSGLTNGTAYTFTATATNAIGTSTASLASNSVSPTASSTVPGTPTIGTATAGNAEASVTFTAPVSNGGSAITGYTVTSSPGGITGTGSTSPITVSGLTNGTAYTFTATATNAIGTGSASSASNSVTPTALSTVPGAPTIGTATAGNAQASVTFTAPVSDGGSAITGYTVTSSPGGKTGTGTASPITVSGLTNGTAYTFTATATNAVGTGSASSASNSVTPTAPIVPEAPTVSTSAVTNFAGTSATVGGDVTADGGAAVTDRGVYYSTSAGAETTGTKQQIGNGTGPFSTNLTGLTDGTTYYIKAYATNSEGTSYGSEETFTTITVFLATVSTAVAANIAATSAIVGGNVTSDGNGNVTERGIYYSTSAGAETTGTKLAIGNGTGTFSTSITGLNVRLTYYIKAYVTNSKGTSYGSEETFITLSDWPVDESTAVVGVYNHETGQIWMDRNLGASTVATSSTHTLAYGDMYQWGRAADGHEKLSSNPTTTLSSSDAPGNGDFIILTAAPTDWRSPQNDNLWQGERGKNNPCPNGYRIPTMAEWEAERLSWFYNTSVGAFNSLKLPLLGYRSNTSASLNYNDTRGYYWTSTIDGTYAHYMYFTDADAYMRSYYRARGYPVRCIKN